MCAFIIRVCCIFHFLQFNTKFDEVGQNSSTKLIGMNINWAVFKLRAWNEGWTILNNSFKFTWTVSWSLKLAFSKDSWVESLILLSRSCKTMRSVRPSVVRLRSKQFDILLQNDGLCNPKIAAFYASVCVLCCAPCACVWSQRGNLPPCGCTAPLHPACCSVSSAACIRPSTSLPGAQFDLIITIITVSISSCTFIIIIITDIFIVIITGGRSRQRRGLSPLSSSFSIRCYYPCHHFTHNVLKWRQMLE